MIVKPIKTRVFKESEDLFLFITHYLKKVPEKSVIVVTSKIVALSEGRTAVAKNDRAKEKLIRENSELAIRTKYVWLTIKDGVIMASAGIDESNANGKLILLPKDSFASAKALRKKLRKKYLIKNLGVIITDSRTTPLRAGITGMAVGYAGIKGIKDYRGTPDIFGRKFYFSRVNVVDGLAAAAVLTMGEGKEQIPLATIQGSPVEFREKTLRKESHINPKDDIYLPFLSKLSRWRS